jgi:hypothetical protein
MDPGSAVKRQGAAPRPGHKNFISLDFRFVSNETAVSRPAALFGALSEEPGRPDRNAC